MLPQAKAPHRDAQQSGGSEYNISGSAGQLPVSCDCVEVQVTDECFGGLEPQRGYLEVGSTHLAYLRYGLRGKPAMLLHGITSSARSWWRVAPQLAAQGYQVYSFDMPGHGESDLAGTHTIDAIAGLIAQAARTLIDEPPLIVGHSWGGATALALALQLPPARLVLVDPLLALAPATHASRLDYFLNGVGQPRELTTPRLRAENPDWLDCDVFWKAQALEQCREAAVRGLFYASGEWDFTPRFASIDAPVLLLLADPANTIVSPAQLASVQSGLRHSASACATITGTTHNVFRGSGHEPCMRELLPWLQP